MKSRAGGRSGSNLIAPAGIVTNRRMVPGPNPELRYLAREMLRATLKFSSLLRALPVVGAFLIIFLGPTTVLGWTYYLWEDERGIIHATNNFQRVPREDFDKVKVLGSRGRLTSPVRSEAGVGEEEPTESGGGPASAESGKEIAGPEGTVKLERPVDKVLKNQIEVHRDMLGKADSKLERDALEKAIQQKEQELSLHEAVGRK